jgi:hypothetical protein
MSIGIQCDHRRHIVGKGNKRCNNFAVFNVDMIENDQLIRKHLCEKHREEAFAKNELIKTISYVLDHECPECGAKLDFSKNIPLCPTGHPIDVKTQKFFVERYPELYIKTNKDQGDEMK